MRRSLLMLTVVSVLCALSSCKGSSAQPVAAPLGIDECATADDCVLVPFEGCCGGPCCPVPFAVTKAHHEKEKRTCMEIKCSKKTCEAVDQLCPVAPLLQNLKAICENKSCLAVTK